VFSLTPIFGIIVAATVSKESISVFQAIAIGIIILGIFIIIVDANINNNNNKSKNQWNIPAIKC
jgi:drug/metabolite transporter (DMT)-like permease